MTRRLWVPVVAVLVAAAAVAAIVLTHEPTPPLSTRVDRVAKTLRCPACNGESVAASDTPIARSMRAEITHQLKDGRSPDQVRAWFVDRYGADIVTTPSSRGPELLLWALPIGVLVLGGAVVLVRSRRRTTSAGEPTAPAAASGGALSGRRVLVAVVVCAVAGAAVPAAVALPSRGGTDAARSSGGTASTSDRLGPQDWVRLGRSLDSRGDPTGAEQAYRRALALAPNNDAARTGLAFDLLRRGHLSAAEWLVRPVAGPAGRYRPLALLVLGLAQRGRGEPFAPTLRRFLRLAPDHPAAAQVRRLLRSR
ncbi:MAG TPA: cytochrome c-type biogenesis protein CcmH [Nocardioides sp.]|uniref:cytochrome c-type biogenesis protein CcmH n=1 Tax=Nocardioides sp. TaxID=35761 RepID=UPI002F3FE820